MSEHVVVCAYEHLDAPLIPEAPDTGWSKRPDHREPALSRYLERLSALSGGYQATQYVELYGGRCAVRLTLPDTPEAATLIDLIGQDPFINVYPSGPIRQALLGWNSELRDSLLDELLGGWVTDPNDPLEIVWDPEGGYTLSRVATMFGLPSNANPNRLRQRLRDLTLFDVIEVLARFNQEPAFSDTEQKIVYIGERPGSAPATRLEV